MFVPEIYYFYISIFIMIKMKGKSTPSKNLPSFDNIMIRMEGKQTLPKNFPYLILPHNGQLIVFISFNYKNNRANATTISLTYAV
ncbi:hypothetical protein CEJ87_14405 [Caldifermentibacillus hisashii]|nr:hypothetical protein CEJ87_14405 [Caldifermentibacillus hisashii]